MERRRIDGVEKLSELRYTDFDGPTVLRKDVSCR
jgi:hypothetical protein